MPFPDIITNVDAPNHGLPGPWLAPNGARYVVLDNGGGGLDVWKSTDAGVTWNIMDPLGIPAQTITASILVGSIIYAVGNNTFPTADRLMVSAFDTATDTWQSSTICGTASSADTGRFVSVQFRSLDSKLVIAGTPLSLTIGGLLRTGYILFDTVGLTFGVWIRTGETGATPESWECVATIPGSGEQDFILVSYTDSGGGARSGTRSVWRQSLLDGGVLNPKVLIDTITDAGLTAVTPMAFSDGTNAVIVWAPTNLNPLAMTVWTGPVSTWALASQALNAPNTETSIDAVAAVQVGSTITIFLATTGLPFTGNFWTATGPAGGLVAPVALGTIGPPSAFWNSQPDSLWANVLGGAAPPWGIVIWNVADNTYYWEAAAGPGPAPSIVVPLQFTIFPFPARIDCGCCPEEVGCLHPSGNGKMYAFTKTFLKVE